MGTFSKYDSEKQNNDREDYSYMKKIEMINAICASNPRENRLFLELMDYKQILGKYANLTRIQKKNSDYEDRENEELVEDFYSFEERDGYTR